MKIQFHQFHLVLAELGFKKTELRGDDGTSPSSFKYYHAATDALIILPHHRKRQAIDATRLVAAEQVINASGVWRRKEPFNFVEYLLKAEIQRLRLIIWNADISLNKSRAYI